MQATIRGLDKWMKKVNTDPSIRECIYFYLMERGTTRMIEICDRHRYGVDYRNMARAQDEIGWRRFLEVEGMISLEFRRLQQKYFVLHGLRTLVKQWRPT
jgi:maltooligosyltrehalose synthase